MDPGAFVFLILLLSALPLFVIAYLIGVRKQFGQIAGLQPDRVADRQGLGRWVGLMVFLIGVVTILMGLGIWLFTSPDPDHRARRGRAHVRPDHRPCRRHSEIRAPDGAREPHPSLAEGDTVKLGLMPGDQLPPGEMRPEGFEAVQMFFGGGADGDAKRSVRGRYRPECCRRPVSRWRR